MVYGNIENNPNSTDDEENDFDECDLEMADGVHMEIDPLLTALKPLGWYQLLQATVYFVGYFSCTYQLFSVVFTSQNVEHSCAKPSNATDIISIFNISDLSGEDIINYNVHYEQCSITVTKNISGDVATTAFPCLFGMHYDLPKDAFIGSEFDLVCDRVALNGLTQTLLMLGQGMGAVLFTALSDGFGRKRIQVICHALMLICGLALGFAQNYTMFAIFKLLLGTTQQGVVLTTTTAVLENFPSRHRAYIAGFFGNILFAFCTVSLTPYAYLLRFESWRILQLAICGVSGLFIFQQIVLDEPLRWLAAKGRMKEFLRVLQKAANMNKQDTDSVISVLNQLQTSSRTQTVGRSLVLHPLVQNYEVSHVVKDQVKDVTKSQDSIDLSYKISDLNSSSVNFVGTSNSNLPQIAAEKLNLLDLVRHKILRKNALICWVLWFISSLTYFSLFLTSESLTDNLYLGFSLNALIEIPACVLFYFIVDRIGRKKTMVIFHLIGGLGLIASSALSSYTDNPSMRIGATVFSLVGKFGASGTFNTVFFFTPEIFPTNIRNFALGTSSTWARIGGMIAPFTALLAEKMIWAPGAIFGSCNLLVIFLIRILPESTGRELPQTICDLEEWYSSSASEGTKDSKRRQEVGVTASS